MKAVLGMHCWDCGKQDGCQDHRVGMVIAWAGACSLIPGCPLVPACSLAFQGHVERMVALWHPRPSHGYIQPPSWDGNSIPGGSAAGALGPHWVRSWLVSMAALRSRPPGPAPPVWAAGGGLSAP